MGFFSWKCAVCDESIPAYPYAGRDVELSHVVMVLPDNTTKAGIYDGYGNIELDNEEGEIDVYETIAPFYFKKPSVRDDVFNISDFYLIQPMIKIVRFDQYHGQPYEELKSSESCPDQGFFY